MKNAVVDGLEYLDGKGVLVDNPLVVMVVWESGCWSPFFRLAMSLVTFFMNFFSSVEIVDDVMRAC